MHTSAPGAATEDKEGHHAVTMDETNSSSSSSSSKKTDADQTSPAPTAAARHGDEIEYVKVINVAASFLGSVLLSNVMNPNSNWKECNQNVYGAWVALCAIGFVLAFYTVVASALRAGGNNHELCFFVVANITFVCALLCGTAAVLLSLWCLHGPGATAHFMAATIVVGIVVLVVSAGTVFSLPGHCKKVKAEAQD